MAVIVNKCAFCENTLSGKNRSKEHIIPNAIGGRKKTTEFICNTCNNKLGEKWDSELAKQLNWFSLSVGISRERGESPKQIVQTITGEKYWLLNDGSFTTEKSTYHEDIEENSVKIRLTAKTIDEAKQRLKGVSRKYPQFDVERALKEMEITTNYLDSPLQCNLSIGGPDAGRSLVKTAFAFASACGVATNKCDKALQYLLDENMSVIPFGFAYLSDLIEIRPKDRIFHCVSLHADPNTKLLWSYIEYFGLFRVVVLLSENYSGKPKNEIYSIDPIDGSTVGVKIKSEINKEELSLILSGNGMNSEIYKEAADYALAIIMERDRSRSLAKVVKQGVEYATKKLGINEGDIIPKELAAEFTALTMHKLSPYIEHLVRSGSKRNQQ
ncbi:HNH endonuclease [Escherichia coli]|uniref:HNH endonuclease n=1 Tax=Escherichia coli TaxID=562 RepID=UPI000CFD4BF6|nr:HNH endonuclease [Escherichia coli]EFH6988884.1 HNH endonuclease [Escherichia coli]EHW4936448.1 HNH endonuclease [Escherichia coli]MCN9448169.1 HNH endonuclease [Escherichia coli]HAM9876489.1 HNH endonuclease [Escherichia coli]HAY0237402.1 HNH endonuclease [Escherichia coli]